MSFEVDEYRFNKQNATKKQISTLEDLISRKASETKIHKFFDENREVFSYALHGFQRGHHGSIVLSKQNIKPHLKVNGESGLIPDFIVGGDSSDGFEWWIVELKGVDETIFTSDQNGNIYFSHVLNKGVFQLMEYIDYCSEHQSYIRDGLKLPYFREPNGLIIVGTENETLENPKRKKIKSHWNRLAQRKFEIHSYNWILRMFKSDDNQFDFRKDKSEPPRV